MLLTFCSRIPRLTFLAPEITLKPKSTIFMTYFLALSGSPTKFSKSGFLLRTVGSILEQRAIELRLNLSLHLCELLVEQSILSWIFLQRVSRAEPFDGYHDAPQRFDQRVGDLGTAFSLTVGFT